MEMIVMGPHSHVIFEGGGWGRYRDSANALTAWVRYMDYDGRLEIDEVRVRSDRVTVKLLMLLPLGRLEEMVNGGELGAYVRGTMDLDRGPDHEGDLSLGRGWSTVDEAPAGRPARPAKIKVPKDRPYPDDFYRQVAEAFAAYAATSTRPAVELSNAQKVPTSAVHRWIREARRRGLMAPARPSR